jgi:hypothetical protein
MLVLEHPAWRMASASWVFGSLPIPPLLAVVDSWHCICAAHAKITPEKHPLITY